MLAVTTFSPEGYEAYGKKSLESLVKHFPGKVVAFYEQKPEMQGVDFRPLMGIHGLEQFLERIKKTPGSDGFGPNGYDFRYAASKFCRKVFAQNAVFDEDKFVFWFDSDTLINKHLPDTLLAGLVESHPFAYLGRKGDTTYTETGWIGFNTQHPLFDAFRQRYLSYFTTGKIFSQLKGWHDCIAFDYAKEGINGNNLTPQGTGSQNVITMSVLGPYMHHYKGDRKKKLAA